MKLNVKTDHSNIVKNVENITYNKTSAEDVIVKRGQMLTKLIRGWDKQDANIVCRQFNELVKLRKDYNKKYGRLLGIHEDKVGLNVMEIPSYPLSVAFNPDYVFVIDKKGLFIIKSKDCKDDIMETDGDCLVVETETGIRNKYSSYLSVNDEDLMREHGDAIRSAEAIRLKNK